MSVGGGFSLQCGEEKRPLTHSLFVEWTAASTFVILNIPVSKYCLYMTLIMKSLPHKLLKYCTIK